MYYYIIRNCGKRHQNGILLNEECKVRNAELKMQGRNMRPFKKAPLLKGGGPRSGGDSVWIFRPVFNGTGLQSLSQLRCQLPLHKGACPPGILFGE